MKLEKKWSPARTIYRIDRTMNSGEVSKWFYNYSFDSRESAQAFIDDRAPTYRGKLSIHAVEIDAGFTYCGTLTI